MILLILLFNSVAIVGIKLATRQGMILSSVDSLLCDSLPKTIYLPLLGCVQCMASVYGTIVYFTCFQIEPNFKYFLFWIGYVCALSVLNVLINNFVSMSNEFRDYLTIRNDTLTK